MSDFSDDYGAAIEDFEDAAERLKSALDARANDSNYMRDARLFAAELRDRIQKLQIDVTYL